MKCYLCDKKARIKEPRPICDKCFSRLFEKRIRKNARERKIFRAGDKVLVIGEVNKYLAESIVKNLPITLFFKKKTNKEYVKKNKINKIVIEWTLDDEINYFLEKMFTGKKQTKNNEIKLLMKVSDEQIKEFARIKGLKFKSKKRSENVEKMIKKINKKYPNAKFNLIKNIEELNRLTIK